MGQKVHPGGFRIGVIHDWKSHWYTEKNFKEYLAEDEKIRKHIFGNTRDMERFRGWLGGVVRHAARSKCRGACPNGIGVRSTSCSVSLNYSLETADLFPIRSEVHTKQGALRIHLGFGGLACDPAYTG